MLRVGIVGPVGVHLHTSIMCVLGDTKGEEGGGKDELFEAKKKKAGTSSLPVSYLADCLIFCGGLHDTSN